VVLLHGQPGAGAEWHRVVDALGDSFDVLAPDRPGYGHSALPAGDVVANVDWLEQLLDQGSDGQAAVIVGHSWAGSVALSLAIRRPDLARGLVLVGSVGPGAVSWMDRLLARPVLGAVATWPAFRVAGAVLRPVLAKTEPEGPARERALGALQANVARGVWRTFLTEQRAVVSELPGLFDQLDLVTTTTMVVAGTRDRVVPYASARALAAQLSNAELVEIARGGHQLHRTHPELIAGVVRRLVADTARP
jgi:pimeloyl-ACP methyl ester carboxylesterase